jgi:hypothetical protein
MAGSLVRISEESKRALRKLAEADGGSMQSVLDRAIEEYRRLCFLREANSAYASLRQHGPSWEAEQAERREWDATQADGSRKRRRK